MGIRSMRTQLGYDYEAGALYGNLDADFGPLCDSKPLVSK